MKSASGLSLLLLFLTGSVLARPILGRSVLDDGVVLTTEDARIKVPHTISDEFGGALALHGDMLVVGAHRFHSARGIVYGFTPRPGGGWNQVLSLKPDDLHTSDFLGTSVAISEVAIAGGAPGDDELADLAGAVHVFTRGPAGWAREAKLFASDPSQNAGFGSQVALSGNTLVVSAPRSDLGGYNVGTVYVFVRTGTQWVEQAVLYPSLTTDTMEFGNALALEGDRLLVGAHRGGSVRNGEAFIFERVGSTWTEVQQFGPASLENHMHFGTSVALHSGMAVIGAPGDEHSGISWGAVWVFRETAGVWDAGERMVGPDGYPRDRYGMAVALDGDWVVTSGINNDGTAYRSGIGYAYRREGSALSLSAKLFPSAGDTSFLMGMSAVLSNGRVILGAPYAYVSAQGVALDFGLPPTPLGTTFCRGDGSAGPCPCGNEADAGSWGGCLSSSGTSPVLIAGGSERVAHDNLMFRGLSLPVGSTAALFVTTGSTASVPFGNGLLCISGERRLLAPVQVVQSSISPQWGPELGSVGGWGAGDTHYFQLWYREPTTGVCGFGFNTSGALELTFAP